MLYPQLFRPAVLGNVLIRNRIVMAPMFTNFASVTGEVTDEMVAHYAARAKGGVGVIIVEAACVSPELCNQGPSQLHISHQRYVIGLNRLSDAIKAHGCTALIQLNHPGRQTTSLYCGGQPVAPSAITCRLMKERPRELNSQEIKKIGQDFVNAAHYASLAGFDGVEIHAAHGYLINQFLSPRTNHRRDEYGGSLENRQRFLLDIIKQIKSDLPNLILSVRLNIDDFIDGGLELKESLQVCRTLENAGVDIIHCSTGTYESGLYSVEPDCSPEGWRVYLAEAVKNEVNIPVITGGMIRNPKFADRVIAEDRADFVFLGRPLLADPQWPHKARLGLTDDIRPCIGCNGCIDDSFKGLGIRCTVNPRLGREKSLDYTAQCSSPAKAVVVGGGPAGMQAALSLQRHGVTTVLFEKKSHLGGLMPVAAAPPYKDKIRRLCNYMIRKLYKSGVQIQLGQECTAKIMEQLKPDVIVIATGSIPSDISIKTDRSVPGFEAVDILRGLAKDLHQPIIVIGGGRTGCEVVDYLTCQQNCRVEIIEKQDYLAANMERKNRRALMDRLSGAGVVKRTGTEVLKIKHGKIRIKTGCAEEIIDAGSIVWATGFSSSGELYEQLHVQNALVFAIGDSLRVRGFREAILEGESIGAMAANILNDVGGIDK